eukprot:scaffold145467_cov18-Tisochrysis_lutea.AAC.2
MALMYDDMLYGTDVFENVSLGLDDPAQLLGSSSTRVALTDARVSGQAAGGTPAIGASEPAFLGMPWPVASVALGDANIESGGPAGMGEFPRGIVHQAAAMEEKNPSCNSGNSSCGGCGHGEEKVGGGPIGDHEQGVPHVPAHPQISSLIPANKQPQQHHLQRNNSSNRRCKKGAAAASASPKDCSTSDEEMNGQLGNRKSTPHSTVEKARRD